MMSLPQYDIPRSRQNSAPSAKIALSERQRSSQSLIAATIATMPQLEPQYSSKSPESATMAKSMSC
jgi:hypothetical protein